MKIIALEEWQRLGPENCPALRGLFLDRIEWAEAAYLTERGKLKLRELRQGLEVEATSCVGVAQFANFRIEVRPKIPFRDLLAMIYYLFGSLDPRERELPAGAGPRLLLELLLWQLAALCSEVVMKGLYRSYRQRSGELTYLRGKLLVKENLVRAGRSAALGDRLYCRYSELCSDSPENRAVRYVLGLGLPAAASQPLRRSLKQHLALFSSIAEHQPMSAEQIEAIPLHRQNGHYRRLLEVCALIADSLSARDVFSAGRAGCFSFFLDMARLFEKFAARLLAENTLGLSVSEQACWRPGLSGPRELEAKIRPDLLLSRRGPVYVADCKYKEAPSREDIYQVFYYAMAYGLERALLILPSVGPRSSERFIAPAGRSIEVRWLDLDAALQAIAAGDKLSLSRLADGLLAQ